MKTAIPKPPRKRIGAKRVFLLRLPDKSTVAVDRRTFTFKSVPSPLARQGSPVVRFPAGRPAMPFRIDFGRLAQYLERPHLDFSDCFTVTRGRRYVPLLSRYPIYVAVLTRFFKLPVGARSSSTREWTLLDGGITSPAEGTGKRGATIVRGAEALRFVCMFFGIKQPLRLQGEGLRRPLALLWEEMSQVPLNEARPHRPATGA